MAERQNKDPGDGRPSLMMPELAARLFAPLSVSSLVPPSWLRAVLARRRLADRVTEVLRELEKRFDLSLQPTQRKVSRARWSDGSSTAERPHRLIVSGVALEAPGPVELDLPVAETPTSTPIAVAAGRPAGSLSGIDPVPVVKAGKASVSPTVPRAEASTVDSDPARSVPPPSQSRAGGPLPALDTPSAGRKLPPAKGGFAPSSAGTGGATSRMTSEETGDLRLPLPRTSERESILPAGIVPGVRRPRGPHWPEPVTTPAHSQASRWSQPVEATLPVKASFPVDIASTPASMGRLEPAVRATELQSQFSAPLRTGEAGMSIRSVPATQESDGKGEGLGANPESPRLVQRARPYRSAAPFPPALGEVVTAPSQPVLRVTDGRGERSGSEPSPGGVVQRGAAAPLLPREWAPPSSSGGSSLPGSTVLRDTTGDGSQEPSGSTLQRVTRVARPIVPAHPITASRAGESPGRRPPAVSARPVSSPAEQPVVTQIPPAMRPMSGIASSGMGQSLSMDILPGGPGHHAGEAGTIAGFSASSLSFPAEEGFLPRPRQEAQADRTYRAEPSEGVRRGPSLPAPAKEGPEGQTKVNLEQLTEAVQQRILDHLARERERGAGLV